MPALSVLPLGRRRYILLTHLTQPNRLAIVYLGVLVGTGDQSNKDKIVSYTVLAVATIVTIGAMWYIYAKMNQAKLPVWRAKRYVKSHPSNQFNTVC